MPRELKAVSNGRLVAVGRRGKRRLWRWAESQPMAAYLVTVAIGRFRLFRSRVAGLPSIVAVDPEVAKRPSKGIDRTAGMLRLFGHRFGPYPFDSIGAIVDSSRGFLGARDPDPPDLQLLAEGRRSTRTRSRTSGSATQSGSRAGRTSGWPRASRSGRCGCGATTSASSRSGRASGAPTRCRELRFLLAPCARRGRHTEEAVRHLRLRARRDDGRGRCGASSATRPSTRSSATGSPSAATAPARSPTSSRSPSSTPAATSNPFFDLWLFRPAQADRPIGPRAQVAGIRRSGPSRSRRSRRASCAGRARGRPRGRRRSAARARGGRRAGSRPCARCSPPSACRRGR